MKYFETLANRVLKLRQEKSLDLAAHDALVEMPPAEHFGLDEVTRWLASEVELPVQEDPDASFGDSALTVARREEFHIQLLSWVDGSTTIHEHSFAGAFTVVEGSSIHVSYDFEVHEASTPHFVRGRLQHKAAELLQPGDVRRIVLGADFIHSVFHLARPTLSLVIRSTRFDSSMPIQLAYTPTLGIDLFRKNALTMRKLQHLGLVYDCFPAKAKQIAREMLASGPPCQSYMLLEAITQREGSLAAVRPLLNAVQARLGEGAAGFAESLEFSLRSTNLIGRREILKEREHRLLLALLLSAPDRAALLELTTAAVSGAVKPASQLCAWLSELGQLPVDSRWGPNALGIDLSETTIRFLRSILAEAAISEASASATDDAREQAVLELTVPRCSALAPLFRG